MKFYTIGYGGRRPDEFLALLGQAGVKTLADVRLRPDRASMGSYTKARTADKGIEAVLSGRGIQYASLIELGNVFLGREDWPALYAELLENSGELLTRRLHGLARPVCLMCSEKRVAECHRRFVAGYLVGQGHEVEHIE